MNDKQTEINHLLLSLQQTFQVKGIIESPNSFPDSILPEGYQEMIKIGKHWSLTGDKMTGVNIIGSFLPTSEVIGDEDAIHAWEVDHEGPNCADNDYKAFIRCGEFEYLFVNTNAASPIFGATRLCITTANEDDELSPAPFINFLKLLDVYSKGYLKNEFEHASLSELAGEMFI
jgi:hypothetical protein